MFFVLSLTNIFYLPKLVVSELLAFSDPTIELSMLMLSFIFVKACGLLSGSKSVFQVFIVC